MRTPASAGHSARAREVLEAALRQQPRNADALYALALADRALRQWETAVQLLSQAAKIDPSRADVQRMLAVAAADVGALEDASAAWNRYLTGSSLIRLRRFRFQTLACWPITAMEF